MELHHRLSDTIDAVHRQTEFYLTKELGIKVLSTEVSTHTVESITLHELTSIIALGGAISFSIAFSFDQKISAEILKIETAGLDIKPEEISEYTKATVAEMANIILGHCCTQMQETEKLITMSVPMVIERAGMLHRPHDASFSRICFTTNLGAFDINCVAPTSLFEKENLHSMLG